MWQKKNFVGVAAVLFAVASVTVGVETYSVRAGQEIIATIASQKLQEESVKRFKNLAKSFACYANDHKERYPDRIEQLHDVDVNNADIKWLNENVEYFGKDLPITAPPYTVIAYDKNLAKIGETAVLFNDTEVVIVSTEKLIAVLSGKHNSISAGQEAKMKVETWENKKSQNERWNPLVHSTKDESVAFSKPFEEKGQTWMTVTHNIKGKDVCLVVIDDGGIEHPAAQTITMGAITFTQLTVTFDIPLASVASFQLRAAPQNPQGVGEANSVEHETRSKSCVR
jgi:hypothetical protein